MFVGADAPRGRLALRPIVPVSCEPKESPRRLRAASSRENATLACPPCLFLCRSMRSEEHTSELQSHSDLVCRLLLEKKKNKNNNPTQNKKKKKIPKNKQRATNK